MWGVNSCTGIAYNHFETSSYLNASQIMSNEELMSILPLQVISNAQTSLNIFLQSEELNEPDAFFCNFCESFQSTSVDHEISKVGSYLVLQLKRFINHLGNFIKDV